jgi:hypothetical protein
MSGLARRRKAFVGWSKERGYAIMLPVKLRRRGSRGTGAEWNDQE